MKYIIDLPHDSLDGTAVEIQYDRPGSTHFLSALVFKSPVFNFEGVPIYMDPAFSTTPNFEIGVDYYTVDSSIARPIARHADGDYEVTVIKAPLLVLTKDCETRGVRAGSSYIVDKFGRVKPGHLAPPAGMSLKEKVHPVIGKPALQTFIDDVMAARIRASKPEPEKTVHFKGTPVFTIAQHAAIMEWIVNGVRALAEAKMVDTARKVAKEELNVSWHEPRARVDKFIAESESHIKKIVDEKLKAYDEQKPKLFVGKTYVTRNGSQVKIEHISTADGHASGHITRGGTVQHGFKTDVGFRKDGKFAGDDRQNRPDGAMNWICTHPLDIMHEVL